jgi:hypothetical protein
VNRETAYRSIVSFRGSAKGPDSSLHYIGVTLEKVDQRKRQ